MTIADVIAARTGQDGAVAASDGPRGRPKRRTFTAEYKLRVLEEYENAESPRERAALLRREGIYTSSISEWRRIRDAAAREPADGRGTPTPGRAAPARRTRTGRPRTGRGPGARSGAVPAGAVDEKSKEIPAVRDLLKASPASRRSHHDAAMHTQHDTALDILAGVPTREDRQGQHADHKQLKKLPWAAVPAVADGARNTADAPAKEQGRQAPPDSRGRSPPHPAALSRTSERQVLDVLDSDRFADKSPAGLGRAARRGNRYYCRHYPHHKYRVWPPGTRSANGAPGHSWVDGHINIAPATAPRPRPRADAKLPDRMKTWDPASPN